jgi:hypothetical protein
MEDNQNPEYHILAGKIVSVEARHASAIRSLINPTILPGTM